MKKHLYEINVIGLTIVLPLLFALVHTLLISRIGFDPQLFYVSLAIWTVFWGIGVRLLIAGITQISKPDFTLRTILGIKSLDAQQVVRELGFANFSIGLAGVLVLMFPLWTPAVALIGGLFLGFDGIEHLKKKKRNRKENIALVTDLFVALITLSYVALIIITEIATAY